MLKILLERDQLLEQHYQAKEGRREAGEMTGSVRAAAAKLKKEKASILESVNPRTKEHTVVSRLF